MKNEQQKLRRQYINQFYRKNKIAFAVATLSVICISLINLILAWLMQQMIDTVSGVSGSLTISRLAFLTLGVIALIIILKAISYLSSPRFMEKAMRQYKNYTFHKLTQKSIASFHSEDTSTYLSAFSNDATTIETGYLEKQFTLVSDIVLLVGAILMMLIYSPLMTLVAVLFFVLPIIASLISGSKVQNAERQVSDRNAVLLAAIKDSLSGFSVIKSFKAEKSILNLLEKNNQAVEISKCQKRKITTVISTIGIVAGVTAQIGTFIVGGILALSGWGITPGVLILFIDLMANVINPISALPELLASRKAAITLIDKVALALESNVRDEGVDISAKLDTGILIKNLTFGYEPEQNVLHDLSYHFEAGKSYAIVGASGSGKSTLLNLLMAAHNNYTGSILYDEIELHDVSSQSLYELVSIIQQNVFVFNASIRDNITMFQPFPKQEIDRAIELSGLSSLIAERGEDYLCGENGIGLSGGEKQRISVARSLLKKSQVLLVDEATASLDAQTAYQVSGAILNLEGLTRIVVTHSLDEELLKQYDEIITLKSGTIIESGSFDDLMTNKGYFYSLYTVSQ